jgi:hypothetical protein
VLLSRLGRRHITDVGILRRADLPLPVMLSDDPREETLTRFARRAIRILWGNVSTMCEF